MIERRKRPRSGLTPSRAMMKRARAVLPTVDALLEREYGSADLGNLPDPLDELIYIQLSIRTREGTYQEIFSALRELTGGDWMRLLRLPDEPLLEVLRRGGMASLKLDRLRGQLERIQNRFGDDGLQPLREETDEDAEGFLTTLPGVGRKAARCVMLYSLDRAVFPVDSHCRRVLGRLGFLPDRIDRKEADDFLQALVPPPVRRSLHINLVHHGRATCLPRTPACARCPILEHCPTGLKRLRVP